jgi:multidrug resistance efflux pump
MSPSSTTPTRRLPWYKTARARLTGAIFLGLALAGTVLWYFAYYPYVSTDDARVAATLIRIAPEAIGGRVIRLNVKEGDHVKKGDVLAELDHRIAEAQLKRAHAKSELATHELKRVRQLVAQRGLAAKDLDIAVAGADSADADLQLAQVALENTTIKSPIDGIIVQKTTEEGNIIEPGQTLLTVVDAEHAWVSANIEETAVGDVRVGQSVRMKIDEGGEMQGHVKEIRASVAAQFALIPSDNGAGNFTKVVQRVPIKVELEPHPGRELRVGQSVVIKIRVH